MQAALHWLVYNYARTCSFVYSVFLLVVYLVCYLYCLRIYMSISIFGLFIYLFLRVLQLPEIFQKIFDFCIDHTFLP